MIRTRSLTVTNVWGWIDNQAATSRAVNPLVAPMHVIILYYEILVAILAKVANLVVIHAIIFGLMIIIKIAIFTQNQLTSTSTGT